MRRPIGTPEPSARSSVAKTTIYRRWSDKDELALAILIDMTAAVKAPPDLGDTRRDMIRVLKAHGLSRVLDLGCGTGDLSRILADHGFRPVGLDVSPAMLARAKGTAEGFPSFPLILGDGAHLPFRPLFDAAVMRFVFHEMDPLLREAVRQAKVKLAEADRQA